MKTFILALSWWCTPTTKRFETKQYWNTNPKETMTTLLPRRLEFSNLN